MSRFWDMGFPIWIMHGGNEPYRTSPIQLANGGRVNEVEVAPCNEG